MQIKVKYNNKKQNYINIRRNNFSEKLYNLLKATTCYTDVMNVMIHNIFYDMYL